MDMTQSTPMTQDAELIARVDAYMAQRRLRRVQEETIHALNLGTDSATELTETDLNSLIRLAVMGLVLQATTIAEGDE